MGIIDENPLNWRQDKLYNESVNLRFVHFLSNFQGKEIAAQA